MYESDYKISAKGLTNDKQCFIISIVTVRAYGRDCSFFVFLLSFWQSSIEKSVLFCFILDFSIICDTIYMLHACLQRCSAPAGCFCFLKS